MSMVKNSMVLVKNSLSYNTIIILVIIFVIHMSDNRYTFTLLKKIKGEY